MNPSALFDWNRISLAAMPSTESAEIFIYKIPLRYLHTSPIPFDTMNIPEVIHNRLADLSKDCGVALRVVKYWENEFRPGWYCWFRGVATESRLLRIELAGTLSIELGSNQVDETDMFLFVNGVRLGPLASPYKYLWRRGSEVFIWDD